MTSRLALLSALAIAGALTAVAVTRLLPGGARTDAPAGPIVVRSAPVPLNPKDPSQTRVGRFEYAGGVVLQAAAAHFGGLSDLEILGGERMLSVSDEGLVVEGRLVLDAHGRLAGVAEVRGSPLTGLDGRPLKDKSFADAEGIAVLPNGDRLVSFERRHRIWRYPATGGAPLPAPAPLGSDRGQTGVRPPSDPRLTPTTFPSNSGMEALAALPPAGPDAYLVGSEAGGVWLCRLSAACRATELGARVPRDFGLTALAVSPDGSTLALLARSFDGRTVRDVVRILPYAAIDSRDAAGLDELVLDDPLTRDNFEGIAVVAGAGGGLRVYVLSDDNFSTSQHTYLLAFDWREGR